MKLSSRIALILYAIGIKPKVIESGGCKLAGGYIYRKRDGIGRFILPIASRELLYALNGGYLKTEKEDK